MESLKERREQMRNVASDAQLEHLHLKSSERLVDADTVAKLFAAQDGEKSEEVIKAFKGNSMIIPPFFRGSAAAQPEPQPSPAP